LEPEQHRPLRLEAKRTTTIHPQPKPMAAAFDGAVPKLDSVGLEPPMSYRDTEYLRVLIANEPR